MPSDNLLMLSVQHANICVNLEQTIPEQSGENLASYTFTPQELFRELFITMALSCFLIHKCFAWMGFKLERGFFCCFF